MKTAAKFLTAAIAVMAFLPVFPVSFAAEKNYTKKTMTAFLYSADKTASLGCLFVDGLDEVPYIDASDYLNNIFTVSFTEKKSDGKFFVACKNGEMTVDADRDTVGFDCYEALAFRDVNSESSDLTVDFASDGESGFEDKPKGVTLNLKEYGIDIIEADGRVYFPLNTIADIFSVTYNSAEYVGGKLYFVHSMNNSLYYDNSSVYDTLRRSRKLADYTYSELCFVFDNLYGAPSSAPLAESIREKGFDKALEGFSNDTKKAKTLLKSESMTEFWLGMCLLSEPLYDGGHTVPALDPFAQSAIYPDALFSMTWNAIKNGSGENADIINNAERLLSGEKTADKTLTSERDEAFAAFDEIISTEKLRYLESGDTGVFSFDRFDADIVKDFRRALEIGQEHGIKNFVIDVSNNRGGNTAVLGYIAAAITNSNQYTMRTLCTLTENVYFETENIDLNLDGKADSSDSLPGYGFNYAVLTSHLTYSCGSLLALSAKDSGIPVLGETCSGGSCMLTSGSLPNAHYYYLSGMNKFVSKGGIDADSGALTDSDLTDTKSGAVSYRKMYDPEVLSEAISEFYSAEPAEITESESGKPDLLITTAVLFAVSCTVIITVAVIRRKRRNNQ